MAFATPLDVRQRISERRKCRYHTDPDYRLGRINGARAYRGSAPIRSLDEMGAQGGIRPRHQRGPDGRFANA